MPFVEGILLFSLISVYEYVGSSAGPDLLLEERMLTRFNPSLVWPTRNQRRVLLVKAGTVKVRVI